jgi:hypothetical protein
MKKNNSYPQDLEIKGTYAGKNPFYAQVEGKFTSPRGEIFRIPGFYIEKETWAVRFSPTMAGTWHYEFSSPDIDIDGSQSGTLTYAEQDLTKARGHLRLSKDRPGHFVFDNGEYHFMNAYECDWLWAMDLGTDSLNKTEGLLDQIVSHKFNTVIMNVYAHDCNWTPQGREEYTYTPPALYVWEGSNDSPDHSRMNLEFFHHFDKVMDLLQEKNLMVHLFFKVYNKMVNYPERFSPEDDLYFKYITARYQSYDNIVWDFSKEAKNEPDKKYILNRINYIKSFDAYNNLVTIHDDPGFLWEEQNRKSIDFITAQQHSSFYYSALAAKYRYKMPYFNSEFQYEHGPKGIKDIAYGISQPPEEAIQRAWEVVLAGGYPAYYYTYTAWTTVDYRYDPPGATYFEILYDFMTNVDWWDFEPTMELTQPTTAFALSKGEEEIIFYPGIRKRDLKGFALTMTWWDMALYEGYWLDIFSGEKIKVERGSIVPNKEGRYHVEIPFPSKTGVLYLKKGNK